LAGEMPGDIEAVFQDKGLSLFPQNERQIEFECSCPDWGNPCKHAAAIYYLVAEQLDVSTSWVQVRFNLLDLPEVIQEEAAAGVLNQYQIKELFSLDNENEQYEAVKTIKNARLRGEKGISVGKAPERDPFKKKRQPKNIVQEMIGHLGSNIGYGLHTRVLAWANGEINTAELYFDIRKYAEDHNLEYSIPLTGVET